MSTLKIWKMLLFLLWENYCIIKNNVMETLIISAYEKYERKWVI